MRQTIERLLIESTSSSRCLLAIAAVNPFLLAYLATHAYALSTPGIRVGLHLEVMWALQTLLVLAEVILLGMALWLWPRRHEAIRRPGAEFTVALVIGVVYTTMPIVAGIFSAGPTLALLGVLVVGMLLFEWRVMLAVTLLCGGSLVAYLVWTLWFGAPYALALGPQAFDQGHPRWWWAFWQGMVLYNGAPAVVGIIMLLFASHDALHRRLQVLSVTDVLTSLGNRRHFMERLQAELARQQRSHHPLSVVLLDADHFKHINDRYGHAKGDEVLMSLAGVLTQCLRGPTDMAARLGGEEFALLLPDTSLAEAEAVCRRLQQLLRECRFTSSDTPLVVTVSMGAVQCLGVDAQHVLRQVDANLYRAKAAGRDRTESSVLEAPMPEEVAV